MSLSFPMSSNTALIVGRTPWSAAGALAGLLPSDGLIIKGRQRVQGDPRGPGGPPHTKT
jgi:hypothetical protein